jgi:biopolymer transport protein ExbB
VNALLDIADAVRSFIEQGGPVLWVIFAACLLLWALILERLWFIRVTWPARYRAMVAQWQGREDRASWRAKKIREAVVSESNLELHALLPFIRLLVTLCPLLGLLGTVLGMVGVFEVIAISGNDNAQVMARGVYRATIPTMAGLVVAMTGIYFAARLRSLAARESARLRDSLAVGEAAPAKSVQARGLPT